MNYLCFCLYRTLLDDICSASQFSSIHTRLIITCIFTFFVLLIMSLLVFLFFVLALSHMITSEIYIVTRTVFMRNMIAASWKIYAKLIIHMLMMDLDFVDLSLYVSLYYERSILSPDRMKNILKRNNHSITFCICSSYYQSYTVHIYIRSYVSLTILLSLSIMIICFSNRRWSLRYERIFNYSNIFSMKFKRTIYKKKKLVILIG